jgi:hypothetical protein
MYLFSTITRGIYRHVFHIDGAVYIGTLTTFSINETSSHQVSEMLSHAFKRIIMDDYKTIQERLIYTDNYVDLYQHIDDVLLKKIIEKL